MYSTEPFRSPTGADASAALPGSLLMGGVFILLCDDIARTAFPAEMALGIITAVLGVGAFLSLMIVRRSERGG